MADTRVYSTGTSGGNPTAGDFVGLTVSPTALNANYTGPVMPIERRALWKLVITVSASTGTSQTLTPSMQTSNRDGVNYYTSHQPYNPMTGAGTGVFLFDVDPSGADHPFGDVNFKIVLTLGGTSPTFTITSMQLYGSKWPQGL